MRHASNMQHIHAQDGKINSETAAFQKMESEQYKQYITAHMYWRNTCQQIDVDLHTEALARRAVQGFKEVPNLTQLEAVHSVKIPGYSHVGSNGKQPLYVHYKMERKKSVEPIKSTKPFQEEKRANRDAYKKMQTKTKANIWQAKAQVAAKKTTEQIAQKFTKINQLREDRLINKELSKGAATAVKISNSVRQISTDSVTNLQGDGWTVVTRKKGKPVLSGWTNHDDAEDKTEVFCDPGMGQAVLRTATRKPTSTGAPVKK